MYEFYYKHIRVKYGSSAKLLFTDTNSLVYEVERDDVYNNLNENRSLFDFIDYPKELQSYDPVNKKVIGKLKDEVKISF